MGKGRFIGPSEERVLDDLKADYQKAAPCRDAGTRDGQGPACNSEPGASGASESLQPCRQAKASRRRACHNLMRRLPTPTNPARCKRVPHKSRTICTDIGQAHWISRAELLEILARPARLERATCGFEVRRSIQLSYGRAILVTLR